MFLSQLNDENQSDVIRDFMKLTAQNLPEKPVYADTENIILLYNQKTDTFWELSVSSMKKGLYAHAEKMDNICTFWELIRKELEKIPKEKVREICAQHIEEIRTTDSRDFRF